MKLPVIQNDDMREWFIRLHKLNVKSSASIPVPQHVFTYLRDKALINGTPEGCRLTDLGFQTVRDILSRKVKNVPTTKTVSSDEGLF